MIGRPLRYVLVISLLGLAWALPGRIVDAQKSPGLRVDAQVSPGLHVDAQASGLHFQNPLRDPSTGAALSCPDPSVTRHGRGRWRYLLFCTSDTAPDAFPIWKSKDLAHWVRDGFVFPRGRQPWWAGHSNGRTRVGVYWAPSIYRINRRWVLYFAARYNSASHALAGGVSLPAGTMVIGVASAKTLTGPWHTRVLHYRGQFNHLGGEPERDGGSIDPGVVRDRRTGQLYLFWADQQTQIWAGRLSSDGLRLDRDVHQVLAVTKGWECDPANRNCTLEGPEPFYARGRIYLMYSAASTWDSSYAVGVAASSDPLSPDHPFVKRSSPILMSAHGFLGAGRTSHPVIGPLGGPYVLYHALTGPIKAHISAERVLMLGRFHFSGGWPLINAGRASTR